MSFDKSPYLARAKNECSQHILSYYPLWKQTNAANLVGFDAAGKLVMTNFINAVIERCDQYEASINGCSNDASAMAVCESIDYSDITP